MTLTKTPIERMNRFGHMWKVWLQCGHTFECSAGFANEHQLWIGKPWYCLSCEDERKHQEASHGTHRH